MQKGIVCKLTGNVATFENTCNDFVKDEVEAAYQQEQEQLATPEAEVRPSEVIDRLNPQVVERLRQTQDPLYAIVGGLAAALVSGILWAAITVATNYQIGYMAIGVGLIVGFAVRYFGSGVDKTYGIIGATYALLGCLLGNFFTQLWFIADYQSMGLLNAFKLIDLATLRSIYAETFSPIDLLFYGIAIAEGYNFAFRKLSIDELEKLSQSSDYIPYPANHKLRMPLAIGTFAVISVLFFVLRGNVNGTQTFYYESGAKMSEGELMDGEAHGFWTYYNEYGNVILEGNYEHGIETGKWTWYDGSSAKTREGNYKAGMADGLWINFYPNGQFSDSGSYKNGRMTGEWTFRYENGALAKKGTFTRDKPSGKWLSYYENGKKMAEENYVNGKLNGRNYYYYDNGEPSKELEHIDDKIKIINSWSMSGQPLTVNGNGKFEDHYQRNRTISHSGEVKDGKKTGTWKMYYENGNIQAQGVFDDNDIFVINKFWNKTGNLLVEDGNGTVSLTSGNTYESGRLINGYRDGVWQVLDDSGILYSETTYKNGKADGAQKFYYPSEALNIEGYNSDDKKNGLWYWYYENGQVETSLTYVNDKKDGVQEFYNEQGTKVKEEIYKDGELVNEILVNLQ
ncbi:hypothetical protein [Fulvivirga kasyanovii]